MLKERENSGGASTMPGIGFSALPMEMRPERRRRRRVRYRRTQTAPPALIRPSSPAAQLSCRWFRAPPVQMPWRRCSPSIRRGFGGSLLRTGGAAGVSSGRTRAPAGEARGAPCRPAGTPESGCGWVGRRSAARQPISGNARGAEGLAWARTAASAAPAAATVADRAGGGGGAGSSIPGSQGAR